MPEIILEEIAMPPINRKYRKHPLDLNGKQWVVKDGLEEIYRGNFENASLICYNLNKKYYKENPWK